MMDRFTKIAYFLLLGDNAKIGKDLAPNLT
jgi:hypothetical protein